MTIVNGMRQGDPANTFLAKVKATYMADMARSYKRHKHVQTGIKPLD